MDFVDFELAKKLKEKGFREKCLAYYSKDTEFYYNTSYGSDVESAFKSFNSRPNHICGKRVDAPTISQVLKWLREEKKIHVRTSVYSIRWCVDVTNMKGTRMYSSECEYQNYEQAVITEIEYVLNNLI